MSSASTSASSSSKPGITVCAIPGLTLVMRSRDPDFDPSEIYFVAQFPVVEGEAEPRDKPMTISFSREVDEQGRFFRVSVTAVTKSGSGGSASWVDSPPVIHKPIKSALPPQALPNPTLDDPGMAGLDVEPFHHVSNVDRSLLNNLSYPAPPSAPAPNPMMDGPTAFDIAMAGLLQSNPTSSQPPMIHSYTDTVDMNGDTQMGMFNENDWLTGVSLAPAPDLTGSLINDPSPANLFPHSNHNSLSPTQIESDSPSSSSDSSPGFPCRHGVCGRTFSRQYNRDLHENSHVPKEPVTYACRVIDCNATFRRQHDRMRHEVGQHQIEPDYSCNRCGKFYGTERRMHSHKCNAPPKLAPEGRPTPC